VTTKLLSPLLIAATIVETIVASSRLPKVVSLPMQGMLPFAGPATGDTAPRWMATLLLPLVALVIWIGFQTLRTSAGLRQLARLFRNAPASLGLPESIDRIGATYDTVVLWVIVLVLGSHAGLLATTLGFPGLGARVVAFAFGASMIGMGNVIPRLRSNLIAGIRTTRTITDPPLWRSTHRFLGYAYVAAGIVTIVVGLLAPAFGLVTALATLLVATIGAGIVPRGGDVSP
jgi:hypothetical protein